LAHERGANAIILDREDSILPTGLPMAAVVVGERPQLRLHVAPMLPFHVYCFSSTGSKS